MKMRKPSIAMAAAPLCALAVLAAGCGSEGANTVSSPASPASATAPAADKDASVFMSALRDQGLPIDSDEYAIALAYSACGMLGGDFPPGAAEELVRNGEPDFSEDQVTFFMAAAKQHYCAQAD